MLAVFAPTAKAETFNCPPPQDIRCVPAVTHIGDWVDNGGQETGNTFGPNNQCANVIHLGANDQRLLCCYTKCGVFLRDVKSSSCEKISESQFTCH